MLKTQSGKIIGTAGPDGEGERFMRRPAVEHATGLPTSTLWEYVEQGRFPKPVHISARIVVWLESEVQAWIRQCIKEARDDRAA